MQALPEMTLFRSHRTAFAGLVLSACIALASCTGIGGGRATLPPGTEIDTPGIETYVTAHNGYSRARIDRADSVEDSSILAQFDDADATGPAGYRNLITQTEQRYLDTMQIEVIAEITAIDGGEKVIRVLRLTADQAPFDNVGADGKLIAKGEFFFRGSAEVYAIVDGGELKRGVGTLENMVVNFDTETVSINLRTPFNPEGGSEIETEMLSAQIPLNIRTGAFGGPVSLSTRSADTGETLVSDGVLRGNLNGDADGLSRLVENMTTSGLFTVGVPGDRFTADGVFWGSQLNNAD